MTALEAAALLPMLLPSWMDPDELIKSFGPYALWGVAFIIFAECGLFAILPGDSLLFTVGLLTATGVIPHNLAFVCIVLTIAAVLGNISGYAIGRKIGPPLFRPRSGLAGKIFKQSYVDRTHIFFERYGNRALILARFVPIVRTFVTLVAGVGKMDFRHFITYTAIGGVLWACGVTIAGYFLGNIPFIKNNIDLVLILIVAASLIPMGVEYLLHRRRRKQESRNGLIWQVDSGRADAQTARLGDLQQRLKIISAGHPQSGGDILLDLLGRGGTGDHRANSRHRHQPSDRDLEEGEVSLGRVRLEGLDQIEVRLVRAAPDCDPVDCLAEQVRRGGICRSAVQRRAESTAAGSGRCAPAQAPAPLSTERLSQEYSFWAEMNAS